MESVFIELVDNMLRYKLNVFDHEPAGGVGVAGPYGFQYSPVLLENAERSVTRDRSTAVIPVSST